MALALMGVVVLMYQMDFARPSSSSSSHPVQVEVRTDEDSKVVVFVSPSSDGSIEMKHNDKEPSSSKNATSAPNLRKSNSTRSSHRDDDEKTTRTSSKQHKSKKDPLSSHHHHAPATKTSTADAAADFASFDFYLMGDTPYAPWEDVLLQQQVKNLTEDKLFAIHVGDMQKVQRTNCSLDHYKHIQKELIKKSPVPTLILPGDNDWYDCEDPPAALEQFRSVFYPVKHWPYDLQVHPTYPELLAWWHEGILFITVHLIHGNLQDLSWQPLLTISADWVHEVVTAESRPIRGIFLLGHSLRSPRTRPFFEYVWNNTMAPTWPLDKMPPTMYMHGDGHDWSIDTKFSHQVGWKFYHDIQCDQGGLADPLVVSVAPTNDRGKVLEALDASTPNQYTFAHGFYRIDRQRGMYDEEDAKKQREEASRRSSTRARRAKYTRM